MEVFVTLPARADYVEEVAALDIVSAVRFNTVLPVTEPLSDFLRRYAQRIAPKPLWIDLKGRQLRIMHSAYIPYSYLEISHSISVDTPVEASFCSGQFTATVTDVQGGNRLLIDEVSPVPLGSGMSLSIAHPSLRIHGYLTQRDRAYVAAARQVGIHNFMLSYVEQASDLADLRALDPEANIIAKVESETGMAFTTGTAISDDRVRLMAARGDLFNELERPHHILNATKRIVRADPNAIAASRFLSSTRRSGVPSCSDLSDLGYVLELGYRAIMLGDELCFDRRTLLTVLNVLDAVFSEYR